MLVLPAAIGSYLACSIIITLGSALTDFFFSQDSKHWNELIQLVFCPLCMVHYGAKTAPRHRVIVAFSLAILHAMAWTALMAIALTGRYATIEWNLTVVWRWICIGVGVISPIVLAVGMYREEVNEMNVYADAKARAIAALVRESNESK